MHIYIHTYTYTAYTRMQFLQTLVVLAMVGSRAAYLGLILADTLSEEYVRVCMCVHVCMCVRDDSV